MVAANKIVWTFGISKPTVGDTPSTGPQLLRSTSVTHLLQLFILQTFYQLGTKYRSSIQIYESMGVILIQTTAGEDGRVMVIKCWSRITEYISLDLNEIQNAANGLSLERNKIC